MEISWSLQRNPSTKLAMLCTPMTPSSGASHTPPRCRPWPEVWASRCPWWCRACTSLSNRTLAVKSSLIRMPPSCTRSPWAGCWACGLHWRMPRWRTAVSGSSLAPTPVVCQEGWFGPLLAQLLVPASSGQSQPGIAASLCPPQCRKGPWSSSTEKWCTRASRTSLTARARPTLFTSWRRLAPPGARRTGSSQQLNCPFPHCIPKGSCRVGALDLLGEAVGCKHQHLARPPGCNREVSGLSSCPVGSSLGGVRASPISSPLCLPTAPTQP
ncbi:phytanoyl-CoA dioxygenase domain-containing protein 1 isoform X5 [Callithrix jacchus]